MPTRRLRVGTWVAVVAAAAAAGPGRAADPLPVKLDGLLPAGRPSTTDRADSVLWFSLENPNPEPRAIRVLVFYNGRPDVQYGRDVWVPGRAKVKSWVTIGPPPRAESIAAREIKYILSDRTDGPARVLTPPPERMPGRGIPYMTREPSTAVLLDQLVTDAPPLEAGTPAWRAFLEVVELIQTFRASRGQTEFVFAPPDRFLPPTAAALDGLDQVVLAGDRLAADPVGARAVREWVLGGGTLWVMLDRVDPGTVALVLGEDPGFEVAGRTTLTEALLVRAGDDPRRAKPVPHDDPVEFVRVLPTGPLTVLIEQDGWPAAFTRPFGRGKVVVTTAGARAWHRPRVLPVGFRGGNRPQP
ncbi:MAG: hypothetical protein K2X82_22990, partial [Gemmataceae bacterium]|nr:hypothetical protein [Gemmataceae bacterium]